MKMKIRSFIVGPIDVNCYILKDEDTGTGIVIDPGGNGETLLDYIKKEGIQVAAILNTHAHADHLGAVEFLRDATGAKFYIHEADAPMLSDAQKNLSVFIGKPVTTRPADVLMKDGDALSFGGFHIRVIHTPGHSPGGVCLYMEDEKILFSGDSLFAGSVGRTDFPGCSMQDLMSSLREKIMKLPEDTKVYTGHGPSTEIGWEKQNNPYLY